MRALALGLFLLAGCTNVEDDILPPDAAVTDGPRDAPMDVCVCDANPDTSPPDAGVD